MFFFLMQNGRYMIKVYRIATELSYNRLVKAKNMHHTLTNFGTCLKIRSIFPV